MCFVVHTFKQSFVIVICSWISVSRGIVFTERICWSEDLKTAVVVGLLHYHLKNLPPKAGMNCWLTVHTAISDPELVFGSHSSPPVMSELVPICENFHGFNSCGSGAVEDASGIAKKFPENMSQMLGGPILHLGIPRERLWIPPRSEVGKTLVDWQHGIGHCVLIQHLEKSLESFKQLISFCTSCILPATDSVWSSTNLRLAIVSNICSWRSGWSCRRRSSPRWTRIVI